MRNSNYEKILNSLEGKLVEPVVENFQEQGMSKTEKISSNAVVSINYNRDELDFDDIRIALVDEEFPEMLNCLNWFSDSRVRSTITIAGSKESDDIVMYVMPGSSSEYKDDRILYSISGDSVAISGCLNGESIPECVTTFDRVFEKIDSLQFDDFSNVEAMTVSNHK